MRVRVRIKVRVRVRARSGLKGGPGVHQLAWPPTRPMDRGRVEIGLRAVAGTRVQLATGLLHAMGTRGGGRGGGMLWATAGNGP